MFPDFSQTLSKDRHFLRSAFKNPNKYGGLAKVEKKYKKSHDLYLQRLSKLPKPEFDNTLPVHEKLEEIKKVIAENQVTIICGETGSGKTTQLPKICLELGRGAAGLIGHTQPRRLAARSVAERIAEELKSEIGSTVGYKVRFTDHTSRDACVKLMTDGILLAETQTDRYLAAYDTIIIDEAHERSLNIDFLLGYLKQLLPRRPDLKVIITSATIDAERFSQHFNGAPVLEVSGRTYPVEILYRPLTGKDEDDAEVELTDAIVDAADELARYGEGDILVFLPGEREIREAAEALRKSTLRRNDEILPLFARRAAQNLPPLRRETPHRIGNQRRRNLAHRAGHQIRHRHRPRARQTLFRTGESGAASYRKNLPSRRPPTLRPLRPRLRRRVYQTVFRRRFQQPPRIYRPRNRPQQPRRRHPAHGIAETRRRSGIPIFRNARFAVY